MNIQILDQSPSGIILKIHSDKDLERIKDILQSLSGPKIENDTPKSLYVQDVLLEMKREVCGGVRVCCDGGCRNPWEYQGGYGSYQIESEPIVKMEFGNVSSNASEILILVEALKVLKARGERSVAVVSDSRIMVNRVNRYPKKKHATKGSHRSFQEALDALYRLLPWFDMVRAEWRSREHSVARLGH